LQEQLLRRDLFEEFCNEFTREMNRLRMAARAGLTAMEQELSRVDAQISKTDSSA
jgi:site-specific DNA recombinase